MNRLFLVLLAVFQLNNFTSQNYGPIEDYIPEEFSSYSTHPILTIKTTLHIVYRTKNHPKNIKADNLDFINQQYQWINNSYKNLKSPTLLPENKEVHYIPDSRIRFRLDTILVHYDSIAWDRIYTGVAMNGSFPLKIDSVNLSKNEIKILGRWENVLSSKGDSLAIGGSTKNNGTYHTKSFYSKNNNTYVILKEPLKGGDNSGNITYFRKIDKNCWKDNWERIAGSDKNSIHVFYTGATSNQPAFGCGPSPYFLNLSKLNLNGDYASASLTAHELGHCLGLRHTNYPQFNDLPPRDKFGFIPCDSTNTSNNIMGYNKCRNYLSPKQIGYIHQKYSNDTSLIRTTANGEYSSLKTVKINWSTTWNKAVLIGGDLIIKPGRTLTLNKMVSMAKGSTIYLCRKSKLIINGTVITNNHGEKWGGVIYCKSYVKRNKKPCRKINYGQIVLENGGALENYIK